MGVQESVVKCSLLQLAAAFSDRDQYIVPSYLYSLPQKKNKFE